MPLNVAVDRRVIADVCRRHGIRRLAIFGSALRPDFAPTSDVDVLVEFAPEARPTLFDVFEIEEALSPAFGGCRVDVRTRSDLSRYFRDEVVRAAEVQFAEG